MLFHLVYIKHVDNFCQSILKIYSKIQFDGKWRVGKDWTNQLVSQ